MSGIYSTLYYSFNSLQVFDAKSHSVTGDGCVGMGDARKAGYGCNKGWT